MATGDAVSHYFFKDAQANGYVASLDNHKEIRMGILHAVYGQICNASLAKHHSHPK